MKNLALGSKNIFPAAQIPDVSFSDIRNHGNLRVCHPGQDIDFSQMIHPHLDHRHLGLTGDLQEGARHADVVIEISIGFQDLIAGGKNSCNHVLGRRLADRTRDGNHRQIKLASVIPRQISHRPDGVLHQQIKLAFPIFSRILCDHATAGTRVKRRLHVPVSVRLFSHVGKKNIALPDLSVVAGNAGDLRVFIPIRPDQFAARTCHQLP